MFVTFCDRDCALTVTATVSVRLNHPQWPAALLTPPRNKFRNRISLQPIGSAHLSAFFLTVIVT